MTFEDLFKKKAREFEDLCEHYDDLHEVMDEIDLITKGKSFRIRNSFIWNMLKARIGKLYIDVVEYIDAVSKFLNTVTDKYQENIRVRAPLILKGNATSWTEEFTVEHFHQYKQGILQNFFGNCKQTPRPHQYRLCVCDLSLLKDKLKEMRAHLEYARLINAHQYRGYADPNNISLKDVKKSMEEIKTYLGYIATFSGVGVSLNLVTRLAEPDHSVMAKDVVDMILCGPISQIPFDKNPWEEDYSKPTLKWRIDKQRAEFYENLHKIHDELLLKDPNDKHAFNDPHGGLYFQFSEPHKKLFIKPSEVEHEND